MTVERRAGHSEMHVAYFDEDGGLGSRRVGPFVESPPITEMSGMLANLLVSRQKVDLKDTN